MIDHKKIQEQDTKDSIAFIIGKKEKWTNNANTIQKRFEKKILDAVKETIAGKYAGVVPRLIEGGTVRYEDKIIFQVEIGKKIFAVIGHMTDLNLEIEKIEKNT